jgi:hypothetical protein
MTAGSSPAGMAAARIRRADRTDYVVAIRQV